MQAALHFQLSSTSRKKHSARCPLDTCKPQISFIFFSPFPFSLLLKDPPELHSAELLTFCSTFVSVPFVSVTEREREQKSSDRKNVKACLCAIGGRVVGVEGGIRKKRGPGVQDVVDESRGEGVVGSDRAGEVKEDCHRNDVRDKAIIP